MILPLAVFGSSSAKSTRRGDLYGAVVALTCSVVTWALVMPIYGIVSKAALFLIGFAAMRLIGRRRVRAMPDLERDALLAATGRSVSAASP